MAQAGLNYQARLWRFSNKPSSDDDVGGSIPSGTILKDPVLCHIQQSKSTQVLLEQGLELPEMFEGFLSYVGDPLDIRHNDQLEVYYPPISPFFMKRFRIIGYRHSSHMDARRFVEVTMRRWTISRTEELQ